MLRPDAGRTRRQCSVCSRLTQQVRRVEGDHHAVTLDARHAVGLGAEGAGTTDTLGKDGGVRTDRHTRASHKRHCAPDV